MNELEETELRRLRWKSRRGMRELDQLFGRYLDRLWRRDSEEQRGVFRRLLACEDDKLWHWFMGHDTPADAELADLVQRIRSIPPG